MRMYDLLYAAFVHRLVDWPCQISPFAIQFSVGVASVRWWEVPGHDKEMSVAVCSRRLRHAVYTWIEPHGFYCSLPKYVPACWEKWPPKQLKFGNGSWWHFSTGTSTSDWKNHMRGKSSHKTKGQPWSCFWQAWYTEPYLFTCMPIFGWILLSKGNFQLKLDPLESMNETSVSGQPSHPPREMFFQWPIRALSGWGIEFYFFNNCRGDTCSS